MFLLEKLFGRNTVEFFRLPDNSPLTLSNKPYLVRRNRFDGEMDIRRIMENYKEEEVWFYSAADETWYNFRERFEISYDEEARGGRYKATTVNPADSSSLGTELIHYHTHNKPIVEAASEQLANEYLKFLDQKDESVREAIAMLARAEAAANSVIPSPGDIETYLGVILNMSKGSVRFKIFNPYGVTCIQFGIRKVNSEQEVDATVRRYKEVKLAAVKSTETDIQKRLKLTIEGINTGMREILHVELKPYQR